MFRITAAMPLIIGHKRLPNLRDVGAAAVIEIVHVG